MKTLKCILITIAGMLLLANISAAQLKTYSFEQVGELQKTAERHTIVFIYTNWCQYCQVMKRSTFANEQVAERLNDRFYFVQLNAAEKKSILFNHHVFQYKPNGTNTGTHELAEALGTIDGKLAYPALVILNGKYEIVFQNSGFLNSKTMLALLDNTLQ